MRRVFVSHFQSSDNRIIFLNTQRRIFYSNCGFHKPLFFSYLLRPKNYTAFFRKYMACILKQVPCILKYMPYVFYEIRKQKFPHHKASFLLSLLVQIVIHPLHFPTKSTKIFLVQNNAHHTVSFPFQICGRRLFFVISQHKSIETRKQKQ